MLRAGIGLRVAIVGDQAHDEAGRLAALRRYAVLDTQSEPGFERITELVQLSLGVPIAAVSLIDDQRQWFKSEKGLGICETSRDLSFCAALIERKVKRLVVADSTIDPRFCDHKLVTGPPFIRSYLGVPLVSPDGYVLGALCAIDTAPRRFDEAQIGVMERLAELVMAELELRLIASTDELTGVSSRRAFMVDLARAFERQRRHGRPACLAMLDIDHFKAVNDSHGHGAGDAVLTALAALIKKQVRQGDTVGRLGGEEFAILMPETGQAEAAVCIGRLREAIAALRVRTAKGAIKVTASFGMAALTPALLDIDAWLAAADGALYRAKRAGRNCCMAAAA